MFKYNNSNFNTLNEAMISKMEDRFFFSGSKMCLVSNLIVDPIDQYSITGEEYEEAIIVEMTLALSYGRMILYDHRTSAIDSIVEKNKSKL